MYRIYRASPKALAFCPKDFEAAPDAFQLLPNTGRPAKYPFRRLAVGTCFTIPYADLGMNGVQNLRTSANNAMKITEGRKFKVIMHPNEQVVEVARIL